MPIGGTQAPSDRRREERLALEIPVELEDGGEATTRNVSEGGVLFETQGSTLAVGDRLRLWLVLTHVDPEGPLYVEAEGAVVRVERESETSAVAVHFSGYRLTTQRGPANAA